MIPHRPEWLVGSVDDLRRLPPPWPVQRDCAQHANVEVPLLLSAKVAAAQDPVRSRGERLVFTSNGVRNYVDQLARVVQLRVAIERCCSFEELRALGLCLLNYGVLTMSIAPKNRHGAQVQLALERGLPAMIRGLVGYHAYPSKSFDMVHCDVRAALFHRLLIAQCSW
ncbi:unnamed protein product [Urochloa humidicola]